MGNPFGKSQPCAGTQASLPAQCQCADPGVVLTGQDVIVADANLCPRRLLPVRDVSGNVVGAFVVYGGTGQQESVFPTNQPSVPVPAISVAAAQSFGSLLLCTGTAGLFQRVTPPNTANLYLQTDGAGGLQLAAAPAFSVPNPLNAVVLNVSGASTLAGQAILQAGVQATGLSSGTVANLLAIDSGGNFIKTAASGIVNSRAWVYEAASRAISWGSSGSFPNLSLTDGSTLQCPYKLYDVDGILNVSSGSYTGIQLVGAGAYEIVWQAGCNPLMAGNNTHGSVAIGISLYLGSSLINPGTRSMQVLNYTGNAALNRTGEIIGGRHVYTANANDVLNFKVVSPGDNLTGAPANSIPSNLGALGIMDFEVSITKFK